MYGGSLSSLFFDIHIMRGMDKLYLHTIINNSHTQSLNARAQIKGKLKVETELCDMKKDSTTLSSSGFG